MIDVLITSYNEPKATLRATQTVLKQTKSKDLRVTVIDPHPEVEDFLRKNIKDARFNFFLDPGEGKSYALNLLFQEMGSQNKDEIFILTDGDVHMSDNAIKAITDAFKDQKVGCVTGRPISLDKEDNKYGFWAKVAFEGIDRVRRRLSREKRFFECSGYLFAIRKGVIFDFPMETSEDSIIPFLFWKKGYLIKYVPQAEVYIKNPANWNDYIAQKVRNIKAHENLNRIAPDMPRTKSFLNEVKEGTLFALQQPKNFRETIWILELFAARLHIYLKAFSELKEKRRYEDGWRGAATTESTKTLD